MKFRPLLLLLLCAALPLTALAAEEAPAAPPKRGLMHRLLHPFGGRTATPAPKPAAAEAPPAPSKPGLMHRVLHPFGGGPSTSAPKTKDVNFKNLEMGLTVDPAAPRLSEDRAVKVTVTLANKGRKLVQLAFPTTQRIEVLVKNRAGKMVVQWSEDRSFLSEPTLVAINPRERLEYAATVSTRDLVAGESYTVEAFFPNFELLRQTHGLAPVK